MATKVNIVNKKTANASENVSPARKGNVSSSKAVTKVENGEYKEMISNLMDPSHPFLLPRTVPTSAGVIFHKPQISVIKNLEEEPFGVMIVRPSVTDTVTYSAFVAGTVNPVVVRNPVYPINNTHATTRKQWSITGPLELSDGNTLNPDISFDEESFVVEADGSKATNEKAIYPGLQWNAASNVTLTCKLRRPDGAAVNSRLRIKNDADAVIAQSVVTATDAEHLVTHTIALAAASPVSTGFEFEVLITDIDDEQVAGEYSELLLTGFHLPAALGTITLSLWDMLGNMNGAETSRRQYEDAERYSITAFSCLFQNTTAAQYKSGSIVAAQLPGGSEHLVPSLPEDAYRFIASYNDPKTHSGQLNKGLHWFFSPEKVQDWFFRTTEDSIGDRPYLALAWSGVAVNDLANMLGFTVKFGINIELLTTDISLMKFMPTPDLSRLFDLYVTMVNAHNSVGENPDHRAKIRKIVNAILASPYTKAALKAAVAAGKVVVPLALAAM